MNQHTGDFIVTGNAVIRNEITGVTYVKPGGSLVSRGRLSGGLIVEAGGNAVISGEVGRNLLNEGNLVLNGHVAGKLIGNGAVVMQSGATVAGNDLPPQNVTQSSAASSRAAG